MVASNEESNRYVGKIPLKNIWLLLFYASDLYQYLGNERVAIEDNPDDLAELLAKILCHQVESRLIHNLSYGYQGKNAVLNRVRGRIDVLTTERKHLLQKGQIACDFQTLTMDTPRNRYVKAALVQLIRLNISDKSKRQCHYLQQRLTELGVSDIKPYGYSGQSERFGRHDSQDRKMVAAADLVFAFALPTQQTGTHGINSPNNDEVWLRRLFEKAIAGFYQVNLSKEDWIVTAGRTLNWQTSQMSTGMSAILPNMRTDIIIEHKSSKQYLVIDTKFNEITKPGYYREESLRNGYLYQIYAYLRSQEDISKPNTLNSQGMLLHPSIDKMVSEFVEIQGHQIWFRTVNLMESAINIKHQLMMILADAFKNIDKFQKI